MGKKKRLKIELYKAKHRIEDLEQAVKYWMAVWHKEKFDKVLDIPDDIKNIEGYRLAIRTRPYLESVEQFNKWNEWIERKELMEKGENID